MKGTRTKVRGGMVETACVCEPRRACVCGTMRAGSVHTSAAPGNTAGLTCSSCFRKCAWTLSGNDDWNGHEQALSCCVYNYLCRHVPSLKKKHRDFFLHGHLHMVTGGHLFLLFHFFPLWAPSALSVSKADNLINYFNYCTTLQ